MRLGSSGAGPLVSPRDQCDDPRHTRVAAPEQVSELMRALITGAQGFVGRHLAAHLIEAGDHVIATDHRDGGPDITDRPALTAFIGETRPEVVYHLAAQSDVGRSWTAADETFSVNLGGTRSVLEAARAGGVARVLSVTSADIYGVVRADELPLPESAPLRPVSPYAASKAAADMVCLQAFLGYGLGVIRIRSFNHLGPGQSRHFIAPALAEQIAANERTGSDELRVGNLEPRRDFTDVRDVVRAYRLLAEHGIPGEAYNVCTGTDISIRDLAERLVAKATRSMRLIESPELGRPVDLPVLRGDNTKLVADTGWRPEVPLDRTLTDLLDDCRTRAAPGDDPGGSPTE